MGLLSDAALDLDKVPGDKPERQRAAGRVFRWLGLVGCLQRRRKEKAQTCKRKEPLFHGIRLGRSSGEDELPTPGREPQCSPNLFLL
jgi:hypothetical protein